MALGLQPIHSTVFRKVWLTFAPFAQICLTKLCGRLKMTILDLDVGAVHPFTGPINRQDGSVWLAEGETPPMFPDIITMDFYVEGIDSQYPN